jgi:hypothetical protein
VLRYQLPLKSSWPKKRLLHEGQPDRGTTYPEASEGWALEISLDLDMVSAACPKCHRVQTAKTQAEGEAEISCGEKTRGEAAAGAAPKSKIEEEDKQREEAIAAAIAAQNKRYDEIAGVTASSKLQTEELEHKEAVIVKTSVKILKRKVTFAGVPVTIEASKAGTVTICGPAEEDRRESRRWWQSAQGCAERRRQDRAQAPQEGRGHCHLGHQPDGCVGVEDAQALEPRRAPRSSPGRCRAR